MKAAGRVLSFIGAIGGRGGRLSFSVEGVLSEHRFSYRMKQTIKFLLHTRDFL